MNKDLKRLLAGGKNEDNRILSELENAVSGMENELCDLCRFEGIISEELSRLLKSGGKRLRPVLAYLGYEVGKGDPERKNTDYSVIPLMCAVELIHTSSLIHDDIVDKAQIRRGVPTINAARGDYIAVQAGDFMLASAAGLAGHYKGIELDKRFSKIAEQMCLAEFMQLEGAYKYDEKSLDKYYEQIERKTAAFISAAVAAGGMAGGASEGTINGLEEYGKNIGMAFQLRDDILDFSSDENFGKKCGQDLKNGLFTFPLIYALKNNKNKELNGILELKDKSDEDIKRLLDFVKESDALLQAAHEVNRYTDIALEALRNINDTPAKEMLMQLADGLAVRDV